MYKKINLVKSLNLKLKFFGCRGMTLIELLVGTFISLVVSISALLFYSNQHNQWLAQGEISNMQQNLRVGMKELTTQLRLTGANLPSGLSPILAKNTNPDTIAIRYTSFGCVVEVGDHTQQNQAVPIHVKRQSNLSCFAVGQRVYIYRPSDGSGQWFTITNIADNQGNGWKEIHHQGTTLNQDPLPGDKVIVLNEVKYYLDFSDNSHPKLMRSDNGLAGVSVAEDVEDLQFVYTLSSGATTFTPAASDSVKSINIYMKTKTTNKDVEYAQDAGFRKRDLTTDVFLRNL